MAQVELFVEGRTVRVHLNRPDARNALTFGMDVLLSRFWRQVDEDPEIWTVVLTAQGDEAFCIGADMSQARPAAPRLAVGGGLTGIGGLLVPLSKPLVAAVQGFCVGAGYELAMCADVIIAAENAQFRLPETRRCIIGECGVVHRAVRRLPHHVASCGICRRSGRSAGWSMPSHPLPGRRRWWPISRATLTALPSRTGGLSPSTRTRDIPP